MRWSEKMGKEVGSSLVIEYLTRLRDDPSHPVDSSRISSQIVLSHHDLYSPGYLM